MKAIALPINVLVIVAVSVIVLTSVIAFYYPSFSSESGVVNLEYVKVSACQALTAKYCKENTSRIQVVNFDADKDGIVGESAENGDNLFMLCHNYYQIGCTNQILGDVNGDCIVEWGSDDRSDIIARRTGPPPGPLPYDPAYDICCPPGIPDGTIDVSDIGVVIANRGKIEPGAERACKKLCGC